MTSTWNQSTFNNASDYVDRRYYKPLSKCFSISIISDLVKKGKCDYLSSVIRESGYVSLIPDGTTFMQLFDNLYSFLISNYRSEYIYKNALAMDIVVQRHAIDEATIFTELPVLTSKADIVIVNGTSSVYEIKTEFDNTIRLQSQIQSYKQAFDKVFVVTHSSLLDSIKALVDPNVGLMMLYDDMTLKTYREAKSNRRDVNPAAIFDILRRQEYVNILTEEFGKVPSVPNGLIYRACKELFVKLPPCKAHDAMVRALRQRQPDTFPELVSSVPSSLTVLGLTAGLTRKQRESLSHSLHKVCNS